MSLRPGDVLSYSGVELVAALLFDGISYTPVRDVCFIITETYGEGEHGVEAMDSHGRLTCFDRNSHVARALLPHTRAP